MTKIPLIRLIMSPSNEYAKSSIGFKYNKNFNSNHKIGGNPDFIQNDDWPKCCACNEKMSFYGQLDSVGNEICIADCGMIYVFVCFDCNEVKSVIQSY